MLIEDLDVHKLSQLVSEQIDQVTCLECCKYYIAPESASCGHSLCQLCWKKRRNCPVCATPLERRSIKLNKSLQTLTEHVHSLGKTFEKLFKLKLDEFTLDTPTQADIINDPVNNVKEWLASSQNKFTPELHSGESSQDTVKAISKELSANEIQIHNNIKTVKNSAVVIAHPVPQDDWDKIETMPEADENINKENIVGPMDIEPFIFDDQEYTIKNPRRSSRMKDININEKVNNVENSNKMPLKQGYKENNSDTEKSSVVMKQNWNNAKRMRKEFSKLNKKNRNKLNVSIEMVKKTQITHKQDTADSMDVVTTNCEIDENTPNTASNENYNEIHKNSDLNSNSSNIVGTCDMKMELNTKSTRNDKLSNNSTRDVKVSSDVSTEKSKQMSEMENSAVGDEKINKMPFLKKSFLYPHQRSPQKDQSIRTINHIIDTKSSKENSNDDIEISIKIGNTVTNIVIKKKENDVQVKLNTDREIQTTLGPYDLAPRVEQISDKENRNEQKILPVTKKPNIDFIKNIPEKNQNKSVSTKHNTSSADTATAQFEITASVEKELSKINMEKLNSDENKEKQCNKAMDNNAEIELLNDMDIFSASMTESNVKLLTQHDKTCSEILVPTAHSRFKTQQTTLKRIREPTEENGSQGNKKIKLTPKMNSQKSNKSISTLNQRAAQDSEPINYDIIMDRVFANIDADMQDASKTINNMDTTNKEKVAEIDASTELDKAIDETQKSVAVALSDSVKIVDNSQVVNKNQKNSENIFSMCENYNECQNASKNEVFKAVEEDKNVVLTPIISENIETPREYLKGNDDDCDSIVEETPQKCHSISKGKQKESTVKELICDTDQKENTKLSANIKRNPASNEQSKSVINLVDTVESYDNDVTVVNNNTKKKTLETPLTINKFVDQIKHKSTPMARKSLNFDNERFGDNDDTEPTLTPMELVAENTQEKEFINKVFDKTQTTPITRPLRVNSFSKFSNKEFCIAGSCLTSAQIKKLKILCSEHKWTYVDKYSTKITHLVVGVDDEKKSQRSVKYMCALAAGKWIISFGWVEKCLELKKYTDEAPYEALDSTGEPGPKRSRISKRKLFQGITFYCMPPFTVLDVETLKNMLEAAGGRVVTDAKQVRVSTVAPGPALLLAEPENTQEDQFMYLAMEQSIVPVNYEWALNCLGSYTLGSIQELLLCPAALLPKLTSQWPDCLIAREYDD